MCRQTEHWPRCHTRAGSVLEEAQLRPHGSRPRLSAEKQSAGSVSLWRRLDEAPYICASCSLCATSCSARLLARLLSGSSEPARPPVVGAVLTKRPSPAHRGSFLLRQVGDQAVNLRMGRHPPTVGMSCCGKLGMRKPAATSEGGTPARANMTPKEAIMTAMSTAKSASSFLTPACEGQCSAGQGRKLCVMG